MYYKSPKIHTKNMDAPRWFYSIWILLPPICHSLTNTAPLLSGALRTPCPCRDLQAARFVFEQFSESPSNSLRWAWLIPSCPVAQGHGGATRPRWEKPSAVAPSVGADPPAAQVAGRDAPPVLQGRRIERAGLVRFSLEWEQIPEFRTFPS